MALQDIDLGTAANAGDGDTLRAGGQKINENFTYLDNKKSGGLYGEWELVSISSGTTTTIGNITTDSGTAASVTKISIHKNSNDGVGFNNAIEDAGYIMFTSAIGESIIFEVESAIDSTTQVAYTVYTAGGTLSTLTLNDIYKISFTTTSGIIGGNVEGGYYINNAYETGGLSPSIYKFTADNDSPQLLTSITINYTVISIMTIDYDTIAGMNRLMVKDFTTGRTAIYSIDSSIDKTTSFTLNVTKLFSSSGMPSFTSGTEYSFAFSSTETGLQKITEGGNTGWRLVGQDAANYGDIGNGAVDLGFNDSASETKGAIGDYSLNSGVYNEASGLASHAEGDTTISSSHASHSEGFYSIASGTASHAEGNYTAAEGNYSHAEGNNTTSSGEASHAEGFNTEASGASSHSEGINTIASGASAHAEGTDTTASGEVSHAEGADTSALGDASHAEGIATEAIGIYSHAEGSASIATGNISHAEGNNTESVGLSSHAEGHYTVATGAQSHAEGFWTESGANAHSQGTYTYAAGGSSHTGGAGWSATNRVTASGESAFNHSNITAAEKSSVAASEYSAILGGTDNNIDISATGAVVLGGLAIQATMAWTTYMNIMHLAPQSSAPVTPTEGAVYYDGVLKKLRCFDGTIWNNLF